MTEPIRIEVNAIVGPMMLQRDKLLQEAEQDVAFAAQAREEARKAAERVLQDGERAAEGYELTAKTKRAYAEHWDGVIAREQQAASSATDTLTDGLDAGEVAQP